MPTPNELHTARLRDFLADSDYLVHEVVDVEPTSSDEESEQDDMEVQVALRQDDIAEDTGSEGEEEGRFVSNQSGGANNNGLGNGMSEREISQLNRDINEKKQWEKVNEGNKGRVSMSPAAPRKLGKEFKAAPKISAPVKKESKWEVNSVTGNAERVDNYGVD